MELAAMTHASVCRMEATVVRLANVFATAMATAFGIYPRVISLHLMDYSVPRIVTRRALTPMAVLAQAQEPQPPLEPPARVQALPQAEVVAGISFVEAAGLIVRIVCPARHAFRFLWGAWVIRTNAAAVVPGLAPARVQALPQALAPVRVGERVALAARKMQVAETSSLAVRRYPSVRLL